MDKASLRRAALAQRRALTPAEVARRSDRLRELLFRHFPVGAWGWLHTFLPLERQNEPDTWCVIRQVWGESLPLRLAAPVVQLDGHSLRHYELTPNTPLVENRWGIPEPLASAEAEVAPAQLDAVLVPLLAVDAGGHRVGYGGGFYDRFLAQCRPQTQFIGLTVLDAPPVPRLADALPTDVRLHACLTPAGVLRFGG